MISLTSTFNNHPLFISLPESKSFKKHNKCKNVSCQATSAKDSDTLSFNQMLDSKNANVDDIKRAYRKMALRYHPDVCEPSRRDECTKIFVELQDTYRSLLGKASGVSTWAVGLKENRRREWENQLIELNRRSQYRSAQNGGKLELQNESSENILLKLP